AAKVHARLGVLVEPDLHDDPVAFLAQQELPHGLDHARPVVRPHEAPPAQLAPRERERAPPYAIERNGVRPAAEPGVGGRGIRDGARRRRPMLLVAQRSGRSAPSANRTVTFAVTVWLPASMGVASAR